MSVLELAQEILALTGSNAEISYMPAATDDPRQRQPNIELIGQLTGWKPSTALHKGLEKTIAYFREELAQ
jgi:UDP-glucuronate decarboxylase